jgi:hypothetical protein
MEDMMLSPFQQYVLTRMQQGTLSNHHEGESAPYRPKDGMYSGYIHTYSASTNVPYRTIAALLKAGLIEESHRVTTETMQGDNTWPSTTIYYRLTEKASQHIEEANYSPMKAHTV